MTLRFALAGPRDEPRLRALAAGGVMPGLPRLSYRREPDFWASLAVQGRGAQAFVCRREGSIVAMGYRTLRACYVDGVSATLGYLGGLRVEPGSRGGWVLARGYRFLKRLHRDGRARAYLSTVMIGNREAERSLTGGRAGLPTYRPWGRFRVHALAPRRHRGPGAAAGVECRAGTLVGAKAIFQFVEREGPKRQFFQRWRERDLGTPLTRGLGLDDFLVAVRDGRVLGTLALWDQVRFRQLWVESYSPGVGAWRGPVNAGLGLLGLPHLPRPGAAMDAVHAACVLVLDDDPSVLSVLLDAALDRLAREGRHSLLIGLHESDPLGAALRARRSWSQSSALFVVHWEDGRDWVDRLDRRRVPALELGAL